MDSEEKTSESTSTLASITEYIYEDEILPEIEIREVISLDSFIKENPRFVAFNQETLNILFNQFFNDKSKADAFIKLHKEIIDDKDIDLLHFLYIYVDATRKDFENISQYFELYKRAQQAPTFQQIQVELIKIAFPFEKGDVYTDKQFILDEPANIVLKQNADSKIPEDISKIVLSDVVTTIALPITGVYWKIPYTKHIHMTEELDKKSFKYIKWNPSVLEATQTFTEWLKTDVRPSFKNALVKIATIASYREYLIHLYQSGYDINNLTLLENNQLKKYLDSIDTSNDDDDDDEAEVSSEPKKYPKQDYIFSELTFLESLTKYHELYNIYFKDERLFSIQEKLGSYIASLPNFQNQYDTSDPYTLLKQVIDGTRTLEDLETILSQIKIQTNFTGANALLKELSRSKPAYITIEQYSQLFNKIANSIIDDKMSPFINIYNDMKEVEIGNDTSKYDGTPLTKMPIDVYEETKYAEYVEEDLETTPEEEVYDSIPDNYGEQFPAITEAHEGIQEIMNFLAPFMIKIKESSGLPWNINQWIHMYGIEIQRESRKSQLLKVSPEISNFILDRICANTLDLSMQNINELNTPIVADKIGRIYPAIFNNWLDDCKLAFNNALSQWLLDLLEASLNGTLEFSIFNISNSNGDLWSPYGYPLDDTKTPRGILYYITAVCSVFFPFKDTVQSSIIESKIMETILDKYPTRLNALKVAWSKYKKPAGKDKAAQAQEDLINVGQRLRKDKNTPYLTTYIKAYYYLPTFLPKKDMDPFKKQPIWAQGCCLSTIDKNYEADNDWKVHIKSLWSMKKQLAKDRWLTIPRDELVIFINDKAPPEDKKSNDKPETVIPTETTQCSIDFTKDTPSATSIDFEANDLWLPKSHYDILIKDIRNNISLLTTQCIKYAYSFSRTKAEKILRIIEEIDQLNDIYTILLKILQSITLKLQSTQPTTNEYKNLETTQLSLFDMKATLRKFLKATGTDYIAYIFKAKYILARAICLPGIPENSKISRPDNVSATFYNNILQDNYTIINQWNTVNSMLTSEEIQAYITKMREEQKKVTLNKLDRLNVDDIQLMKDMKKIGLTKILQDITQEVPIFNMNEDIASGDAINEDDAGETEWLQETTDADNVDEDYLDSQL
jgi:hypothetical protein